LEAPNIWLNESNVLIGDQKWCSNARKSGIYFDRSMTDLFNGAAGG
jgi:hypothetical protein